jgi:hypothetical protein
MSFSACFGEIDLPGSGLIPTLDGDNTLGLKYVGTLVPPIGLGSSPLMDIDESTHAICQLTKKNTYVVYGYHNKDIFVQFKRPAADINDEPSDGELLKDPNNNIWKLVKPYFLDSTVPVTY